MRKVGERENGRGKGERKEVRDGGKEESREGGRQEDMKGGE